MVVSPLGPLPDPALFGPSLYSPAAAANLAAAAQGQPFAGGQRSPPQTFEVFLTGGGPEQNDGNADLEQTAGYHQDSGQSLSHRATLTSDDFLTFAPGRGSADTANEEELIVQTRLAAKDDAQTRLSLITLPASFGAPPLSGDGDTVAAGPAPTLAESVAKALLEQWAATDRAKTLTLDLHLDQPGLGTVHVYIDARDQTVSATLVVHEEAVRLLQSQEALLRAKLEEAGFVLARFAVIDDRPNEGDREQTAHEEPSATPGPNCARGATSSGHHGVRLGLVDFLA